VVFLQRAAFVLAVVLALTIGAASPASAQFCLGPQTTFCPSTCSVCNFQFQSCTFNSGCGSSCPDGTISVSSFGCGFFETEHVCQYSTNRPTGTCSSCQFGFVGQGCNLSCPISSGAVCGGVGKCFDAGHGTAGCSCPFGYTGFACQYSSLSTCNGRGTPTFDGGCICGSQYSGAHCEQCGQNYYGPSCSVFCDSATTCSNRGTCNSFGGCSCGTQFSGPNCNTCASNFYGPACNFCVASSTCNGNGVCNGGGGCTCNTGYIGQHCETPTTCLQNPCQNGGACTPLNATDYTCQCAVGFGGANCSESIYASPRLDCASPDPYNPAFSIAVFGYEVFLDVPATNVPLGPLNAVTINGVNVNAGTGDAGQPTSFTPGLHLNAFSLRYRTGIDTPRWMLNGATVTVAANAPACGGASGATGPTGAAGADGIPGSPGAAGASGPMGATGPVGPSGPPGSTGATGASGPTGAKGADGSAGAVGPTGPAGPTGAAGAIGPMGIAGPTGPAGSIGSGLSFTSLDVTTSGQLTLPPGNVSPVFRVRTADDRRLQLTLPPAVSSVSRFLTIRRLDDRGRVTIVPAAGDRLDGRREIALEESSDFVTLVSDGISWFVIASGR